MFRSLPALLFLAAPAFGGAQTTLDDESLSRLQSMIRPQEDESRWAKVPWLIRLKDARARAVAEDKPLFLWRSGGGDVLGRT